MGLHTDVSITLQVYFSRSGKEKDYTSHHGFPLQQGVMYSESNIFILERFTGRTAGIYTGMLKSPVRL